MVSSIVAPGPAAGGPVIDSPTSPFQPTFGPTVTADTLPPPVSGGTLLVMRDGIHAVASDPDRDAVHVVDLGAQKVVHTLALQHGDEPGRLVEDGAGLVHVALRSGGALVTIDPTTGSILARRRVCPAPRGVAWDSSTNLVWVACATGELAAFHPTGGPSVHAFAVERDLRDVVVSGGALSVSSFRSAEVLRLASDGTISRRDRLPSPSSTFSPQVVWRVVGAPSGAIVAVHQAETTQSLSTTVPGGYGGGACGGVPTNLPPRPPPSPPSMGAVAAPDASPPPGSTGAVTAAEEAGAVTQDASPALGQETATNCFEGALGVVGVTDAGALTSAGCVPVSGAIMSVLTVLTASGTATVNTQFDGVLPVDVAVSDDGKMLAAVAPGNAFSTPLSKVFEFSSCGLAAGGAVSTTTIASGFEQPIAVAFDPANDLVIQTREPAQLFILRAGAYPVSIPLSTVTRKDTGHDIFHSQAGGMIACASCHPEGRDDGHVWLLDGSLRRTPSLRGTIAGTAPYHWPGDQPNLDALVNDVYTKRMSGQSLVPDQMGALNGWAQSVPAPPAPTWVNASAAQHGKVLFNRSDVGCATCHSGAKFTNNETMDVGTGGSFQVPPLVGVGWRTPLLHDGCAATLADRFGVCATPKHGSTGALSPGDVSDLVAYLETL